MDDKDSLDARIAGLLENLSDETDESYRGPGKGLARFARTMRGAAGIAAGVLTARRRSERGELRERDLKSIEQLVSRLGSLKGLPMKVGQLLSYLEADLPDELRRMLALLQTQSQPTPFASVEAVLREDLGGARAEALLPRIDRKPVSAASIGQVYRATLPDSGAVVAVKVRHAQIEEAIRADFAGAAAGTAFARLLVPAAGGTARELVEEAKARLLEECDYALEAQRQTTFGEIFAGHPDIVVPAVFDAWSSRRVLTTAWIDGRDFDAFAASATQPERDRAGRALFEVYIGTLYRRGLFHADPHPGNYRVLADGKVVVFDYGCVRQFEPGAVRAFADLADAVRADDEPRMRAALGGLGATPPKDAVAFAHIRGLLRGFFGPMLKSGPQPIDARITIDTRQIMKEKLAMAKLRLPGKLLFLFRIRFGLYSVLAGLGAVVDWSEMERSWGEAVKSW